jgi:hypothetical protein
LTVGSAAEVEAFFNVQPELGAERLGETSWFVMLRGERKRTIPAYLEVGTHNLTIQSFFMQAPDENRDQLYELLLRRNLRSYAFRFGLTDDGDVLLAAVVPLHAVSHDELDRLLGQLLATADDAFNPALRLGFAAYIDREQAWREKVGIGRNPIT